MNPLPDIERRLSDATEWRKVPGWPYEASDTGIIRSQITGRHLSPSLTPKGYEKCTFQFDKNRREVRVHRAIVEAWIGPIASGLEVNHLDGNKRNNAPSNLEIVTPSQNMAHAVANRLMPSGERNGTRLHPDRVARGSRQGASKLTETEVISIRRRLSSGDTPTALAAEYGVSLNVVCRIRKRLSWTHV